jgi:excisionase family DNA binding protein
MVKKEVKTTVSVSAPSVVLPALPGALLNCQQAAALLNVSPKTIQRMINRKEISYVELSRHGSRRTIRFERPAIDLFVAKRRLKAVA